METLREKINRVLQDDIAIVPYDTRWPQNFEDERNHLFKTLPAELIRRVEHFGSTTLQ